MIVAVLAIAAAAIAAFWFFRNRQKEIAASPHDATPEIDAWVKAELERELGDNVLGLRGASDDEKKGLVKSLRGEPDPDVVGKIEDAVKIVELEYVKFAHETDAEVNLRLRYENGQTFTAHKRLPFTEVPEGVRADFERRGSTHVFRTWPMPWSRVHTL
jgi:hypothetical protein